MATSGLPPLSAVQSTSFAHLSEAAAHWRRLATRWERALAEVRDSMRRPGGRPGRGPRPLPVDRRRGDDRSRGGPAA
ncbi:hypothetical protein MORY_13687 [Mycobacterium orygis 112400015]|uniref:Uncharacterized protein n=1 Tax=Mycobacterium orygis 112400015 TaxID=1305739 RepID=A0A829C2Z2_9MYCO|nr:hypothetical protein MORY_13687 [Mycobacterium orygis 112400015]